MYSNITDSFQGCRKTQKMTTYGSNKTPSDQLASTTTPTTHIQASRPNKRRLCHHLIEKLSHGPWSMACMGNDLIDVCIREHDAGTAFFISCESLQHRLAHATSLHSPFSPLISAITLYSHNPLQMHEKGT